MIEIGDYKYKGCLNIEQIDTIINKYEGLKNDDLFSIFGKAYYLPVKHLVKRLQEHKILDPKKRIFDTERSKKKIADRQYVLDHYKDMSTKEMADALDVTTVTILNRVRELRAERLIEEGYCVPPCQRTNYEPIFDKLKEEYDTKTAQEIADELGVQRKCVYVAASILIRKNKLRSKKEDWDTQKKCV